jgi:hypothetical protein
MPEKPTDPMIRDAFRSTARPAFSPHFDRKLRIALVEEKCRRGAARTRMRLMQAYWLVAGVATIWIISALPWSESPDGAWLPLLAVTATAALPALLTRIDLVDLILGSAEKLRDHS